MLPIVTSMGNASLYVRIYLQHVCCPGGRQVVSFQQGEIGSIRAAKT